MDPVLLSRLRKIEELLKPSNLLEQARTYALSDHSRSLDFIDAEDESDERASDQYARVEEATRQIGRKVAIDEATLNALLPEIVTVNGARLYSFGRGLAEGCVDPLAMWKNFREQLSTVNVSQQNYSALCGFLYSISETNREISEQILNDAVTDNVLGARFPLLQTSVKIDEQGVERLKLSLANDLSPVWTYRYLAYGRAHESISDEDLCDLLKIIASKPDGLVIAIYILRMMLHGNKDEKLTYSNNITSVGQELLAQVVLDRENKQRDQIEYEIVNIVDACLVGEDSATTAKILCNNLSKALLKYKVYLMDYTHLLEGLARKQPQVFLETFLSDNEGPNYRITHTYTEDSDRSANPLSQIADNVIIDWCENNPSARYPVAAASIVAYRQGENENRLEWTPLSLTIIDNAPDVVTVLNEFKRAFRPMSWSGSRADIMQKRLSLLSSLKSHKNPEVSEWACNEERVFEEEIRSERQLEEKDNRSRDERFE
jgi:hypothetical protein